MRPSLPLSSASTDLLHVNRGLPLLCLPSGVQNRATVGDVVLGLSQDVADPAPSSVGQFNHDVFLVAFLPYTFVADLQGPSDL